MSFEKPDGSARYGFDERSDEQILVRAGEIIFEEGQAGDSLYVVLGGQVLISIGGRVIDRLDPGSIFGEMALIDESPRSASASAAVDSKLLQVNASRFTQLIQDQPDFALEVMSIMSTRLRRMIEEEVNRLRLEEEIRIGRRIQLSLLPEECPSPEGWEISATYHAARQVGGDFYDFISLPEHPQRLNLTIADVTGKGVPAAIFMASCRMAIRAETLSGRGPAEILQMANRLLTLDSHSPLFLSAFYGTLDIETASFKYANGGLERPLWFHANGGMVEELDARGMLLGAFQEAWLEEKTIELAPGDFLVFFTDGATEARNASGQFFGDEGLRAVITSRRWKSAHQMLRAIVIAVNEFVGDLQPSDDITLVVVKRDDPPQT